MHCRKVLVSAIVLAAPTVMVIITEAMRRDTMTKEIMAAKKRGASKEELQKLRNKLRDEMRLAKAAGVSHETIRTAQDRGADLDDIWAKVDENNLMKKKIRGVFKKKEVTFSSVLFPGVSPVDYAKDEVVPALVDVVSSQKTQLPIAYYDLPFCKPKRYEMKAKNAKRKNLGELLAGKGQLLNSPYEFTVLKDHYCEVLCTENVTRETMEKMRKLIQREYVVNLSLDGLSAHVKRKGAPLIRGFPLGSKLAESTKFVLYNHLRFTIYVNCDDYLSQGYVRIISVSVYPVSINHDESNVKATCKSDQHLWNMEDSLLIIEEPRDMKESTPITYSYEVQWFETNTVWTDRWDIFLLGNPIDSYTHHMSVLNSFIMVILWGYCAALILVKALRKDLAVYNNVGIDTSDDENESGWKMIHGDVFRPPSTSPMALSVLVGSGLQIAVTILGTLLLSLTKYLTPTMKGQALGSAVLLYVFSGTIGGYASSRVFKFFGGENWKLNTLLTATFFPGTLIALFLALNVFLAFNGSAKTVSGFTIILVFLLWVCVALPLVFIGSFLGFKQDVITVPTRTNQIARVVPELHLFNSFLNNKFSSIAAGFFPFSCLIVELYFLMGAIWMHQYYYLMGHLLTIVVLIGVTSQLIAVIMCYLRLERENHHWWWKAFMDTGSVSLWLFGYSLYYLIFHLKLVGILPIIVYLTYMAMMSLALGLYCGSVSFITVFWLNRCIYSTVKLKSVLSEYSEFDYALHTPERDSNGHAQTAPKYTNLCRKDMK